MSDTKTPAPVHPLLVGTTPGPWISTQVTDSLGPMVGTYEIYNRPFGMGVIGWALTAKDADLFAAAPTLAAENARLRAALEALVKAHEWAVENQDSPVSVSINYGHVASDAREVLASLTT